MSDFGSQTGADLVCLAVLRGRNPVAHQQDGTPRWLIDGCSTGELLGNTANQILHDLD
jgi:hypothetical protein